MPPRPPDFVSFASERAANYLVAGIPAAARAVMAIAKEENRSENQKPVIVGVPGGWQASRLCMDECARLCPGLEWKVADSNRMIGNAADNGRLSPIDIPVLRQQARSVVAATGKPGDGIVSRYINRPVSRTLTRAVLKWSGARPWHATLAAAAIGIAMFVALVFGGETGLLAGAALFQLASIVDGVDGEMARATFRSSSRGAMMDSVTDALTNLGFIGGVSYNVFTSGDAGAGMAGAIGCAVLALGSVLLAVQSRRDGGNFTFDALKTRIRQRPSPVRQWLIWITMRDFYAFAAFLMIMAGGASLLLQVFAVVAAGWFAVLLRTLLNAHFHDKREC